MYTAAPSSAIAKADQPNEDQSPQVDYAQRIKSLIEYLTAAAQTAGSQVEQNTMIEMKLRLSSIFNSLSNRLPNASEVELIEQAESIMGIGFTPNNAPLVPAPALVAPNRPPAPAMKVKINDSDRNTGT